MTSPTPLQTVSRCQCAAAEPGPAGSLADGGRPRKRPLQGRKRAHASRSIAIVAALTGAATLTAGCSASHPSAKQVSASSTFSAAEYTYASCMRAHGLPRFPRPTITDHEGQQVAFMDPSSAIVSSPAYGSASKTCASLLPPPLQGGEPQP
jgi:hypothetical protein